MKTVPPAPEPFKIKEEAKQNLEKWISYLKGLSSRVNIVMPSDKEFNLDLWQEYAKAGLDTDADYADIVLTDWPQKDQVAFMLWFSSVVPDPTDYFGKGGAFVFCFDDKAFGIDYFEGSEENFSNTIMMYSLEEYPEDALSWEYISKIIKGHLQEIEKRIPKFNV